MMWAWALLAFIGSGALVGIGYALGKQAGVEEGQVRAYRRLAEVRRMQQRGQ